MLAATPKPPSSQELFRLVLALIYSGNIEIPDSLKKHFSTVLRQAKLLASGTTSLEFGKILPESIDLAIDLKEFKGLSDSLEPIHDIENVSPDLAHQLLVSMEKSSVYKN